MLKQTAAILAVGVALWASAAAAQEFDDAEQARIKELALQAILEQPEILQEAIAILRARDERAKASAVSETIAARRAELERDPNASVLGAPDGDATVVEFFDYNCPYCKQAAEDLKPLIEKDGGVRLVMCEWPILSEGSRFAARAALAARNQDKYEELHWALMSLPRVDERTTMWAAERLGLDLDRLRADMEAPEVSEHIALSMALARELGITGTPSFVIGDALAPGLIPRARLEALIEAARNGG